VPVAGSGARTNGDGARGASAKPRPRDVDARQADPVYRQTRSSAEPALTLSPPPDDALKRSGVSESELSAAAGRRRGRFGRKLAAQVALPVLLSWGLGAAAIWFLLPAHGRVDAFVPLAAATAVAALLGALMAALGTAGVARDVTKLRDEARRVAMGELTAPVTTNRDDELGEIAGSLERMRLSLQEGLERLRKRRRGA
jgi:HAMP domain-containing protein